jgi:hypothetical protein
MSPDICIYHSPCADGFTAAWAVWRRFGDAVQYLPGVYGQEPPDVTGKHVLMVDFSYKRPVLERMAGQAASIIILDHHKTAEADLAAIKVTKCGSARLAWEDVPGMLEDFRDLRLSPLMAEFDMERSGAQMAWDFLFHTAEGRPAIVDYVADRDLWQFNLPHSREVAAVVFSHPYTFAAWDDLCNAIGSDQGMRGVVEQGAAIERKHHKDIAELLGQARREMIIGGVRVPVANLPYTMASDGAGQMAEGQPFAATYFDRPDARVFSLRSRGDGGADVSEVAKGYGGGGHKNAAGFQMPLGWEGDDGR